MKLTSISKNAYINKLDDIVNKYSNKYHSRIKIKSVHVKSITHIALHKKCPYSKLFWSAFSHIWTEYGEIQSKCVKMRTRITPNTDTFHAMLISIKRLIQKDPKFKADNVRIPKYKNIFAKVYIPNWSEELFAIKKVTNTVQWTYVVNDLNAKEIVTKRNC